MKKAIRQAAWLYNGRGGDYNLACLGRNYSCRRRVNATNKSIIMGDRSPKANQKKSTQKQSKADSAEQKKKEAVFAKQVANKKK